MNLELAQRLSVVEGDAATLQSRIDRVNQIIETRARVLPLDLSSLEGEAYLKEAVLVGEARKGLVQVAESYFKSTLEAQQGLIKNITELAGFVRDGVLEEEVLERALDIYSKPPAKKEEPLETGESGEALIAAEPETPEEEEEPLTPEQIAAAHEMAQTLLAPTPTVAEAPTGLEPKQPPETPETEAEEVLFPKGEELENLTGTERLVYDAIRKVNLEGNYPTADDIIGQVWPNYDKDTARRKLEKPISSLPEKLAAHGLVIPLDAVDPETGEVIYPLIYTVSAKEAEETPEPTPSVVEEVTLPQGADLKNLTPIQVKIYDLIREATLAAAQKPITRTELAQKTWPDVPIEVSKNRLGFQLTMLRERIYNHKLRIPLDEKDHHTGETIYRLVNLAPVQSKPNPAEPSSGTTVVEPTPTVEVSALTPEGKTKPADRLDIKRLEALGLENRDNELSERDIKALEMFRRAGQRGDRLTTRMLTEHIINEELRGLSEQARNLRITDTKPGIEVLVSRLRTQILPQIGLTITSDFRTPDHKEETKYWITDLEDSGQPPDSNHQTAGTIDFNQSRGEKK